MGRLLVRGLVLGGLLLLATSMFFRESLPPPTQLHPDVLAEPEQIPVRRPAFETVVKGIAYSVQPLYSYDISGLVVSRHDSDTFWDHIHRDWNDKLNVVDLCVVWGSNVQTGAYLPVEFSSGQFTCNLRIRSQEAYDAFDLTKISNNHLLTDSKRLAKQLRDVRIGDQVRFRGYLAEYSHNHGFPFKRGTSTVRTDTGDGACETIYVEDFEQLRPGGGPWRVLFWVALGLVGLGLLLWVTLPDHVLVRD